MTAITVGSGPTGGLSGLIQRVDPRVKIGLGLFFGLTAWRVSPLGAGLYFIFFGAILTIIAGPFQGNRSAMRMYFLFVLYWTALKFGIDWLWGAPWQSAAQEAAILGLRLATVLFIGLCLAFSSSPRSLGLALAWLLRPVLGKKAWQAALSLALMVHFMPMVWSAYDSAKRAADYRAPDISARRRIMMALKTTVRVLGKKTWDQTLALAARGLDDPSAWRAKFLFRPWDWIAGLMLVALGTSCLWI